MIRYVRNWFDRHFSNPQVVILALVLSFGLLFVILASRLLAPLIASIIIAYLLEGGIRALVRYRLPRPVAVILVFSCFLSMFVAMILLLLPLLAGQLTQFARELPAIVTKTQAVMLQLPELYPQVFSEDQVNELLNTIRQNLTSLGQQLLLFSLASAMQLMTIVVYLFLVPLLVFFMLWDKDRIVAWFLLFLPPNRSLVNSVWVDVNAGIGNYVRGKFIEILIVWVASFIVFTALQLPYAMLLSLATGLSVIVPYVGAAVVTVPVAAVAYFGFGFTAEFGYIILAYGIIQFIDGNLLAPLLFSEVVDLHPVAVITAILFFGGIWGLWGVFFAIPLATLIAAVLKAWPVIEEERKFDIGGP
ncbi:AI-2E family transporter [Desulfobulbus alkaliphilus]|uniref:AI-2E family transporter n=1 Tax=Desulfobulbus alkaliphilus TaxID=869814 RepID=UPI00196689B0|nr:AI-2E family transporter [Desulfobulbus alkaliphilus]MBM9537133.1 AI-2E family transporter [Desulfobulbus alkaliphilus]